MWVGMGAALLPRGLEGPVIAVLTAHHTIETPQTKASGKGKGAPCSTVREVCVSVLILALTLVRTTLNKS